MLPETLQQVDRTYVIWGKKKFIYFAGCDYLRMSSHPGVLGAAKEALSKYGLNVAASRKTTGNHALYEQLEGSLKSFFKSESALIVSTGYATNLIVAQALATEISEVFIDDKAHASLVDAAALTQKRITVFKHRDISDLRRRIKTAGSPLVMTDGVFAQDGSIAPLDEILKSIPSTAMLLVDDSHGAGVLGLNGRGSLELFGVRGRDVIQTITLSKAFGCYGGAILCSRAVRDRIIASSRMFTGNTPLPLPLANAALSSLKILRSGKMRRQLQDNLDFFKSNLPPELNWPGKTPIFAFFPQSNSEAAQLRKRLIGRKIFPSLIRYGENSEGYFRFAISSEHSPDQLLALADTVSEMFKQRKA